jgi:pilus assembly protein CpaF
LVSAVHAWRRGHGYGPAAPALARLLAERGATVPAQLADEVTR